MHFLLKDFVEMYLSILGETFHVEVFDIIWLVSCSLQYTGLSFNNRATIIKWSSLIFIAARDSNEKDPIKHLIPQEHINEITRFKVCYSPGPKIPILP